MTRTVFYAIFLAAILCLPAAARAQEAKFVLSSPVFAAGSAIPARYTCDGANESPALDWSGAPPGTRGFALIVDDPDAPAGLWTHWVVYDLPPDARSLPDGASHLRGLGLAAEEGLNSFRQQGYGGPCPPSGTHRYFFRLYALDSGLDLPAGSLPDARALKSAIAGHILATAELMGTYSKASNPQ